MQENTINLISVRESVQLKKKVSQTAKTDSTFRAMLTRKTLKNYEMAEKVANNGLLSTKRLICSFLKEKLQDILFGRATKAGRCGLPAAAIYDEVPLHDFQDKTLPISVSGFIDACTDACIENALQQSPWTKQYAIGEGTMSRLWDGNRTWNKVLDPFF